MAVHHIRIKKDTFEPSSLIVKQGDQIQFHISERVHDARVRVSKGLLFDGDNEFVVGQDGHQKTISRVTVADTYRLSTTRSLSPSEMKALEQTGTMNGSITVIP